MRCYDKQPVWSRVGARGRGGFNMALFVSAACWGVGFYGRNNVALILYSTIKLHAVPVP